MEISGSPAGILEAVTHTRHRAENVCHCRTHVYPPPKARLPRIAPVPSFSAQQRRRAATTSRTKARYASCLIAHARTVRRGVRWKPRALSFAALLVRWWLVGGKGGKVLRRRGHTPSPVIIERGRRGGVRTGLPSAEYELYLIFPIVVAAAAVACTA